MKRCLIITKIGFPFGGGEKYLYDTFFWMRSWGMDVCWISFTDKHHHPYEKTEWTTPCIQVRGGFTKENIHAWVLFLRPDIIHTQGVGLPTIIESLDSFHIPILVGFHFWTHLVDLGPHRNQQIIEHVHEHTMNPFYKTVQEHPYIYPYVCSSFLNQVMTKINPLHEAWAVINPTPSLQPARSARIGSRYITHINIHPLKGGSWLQSIVSNCPQWQFQLVHTEPGSETMVEQLRTATNVTMRPFTPDIQTIYESTRILLMLSLVDETYGRVAYEAMFYKIPIITTGAGYLRQLIGDAGIYVSSPEEVIDAIQSFSDPEYMRMYQERAHQQLQKLPHGKDTLYTRVIETALSRVLFLAPYTDQGLGIQTRRYRTLLEEYNHPVFVFSYRSYYSQQVDPSEWDMNHVYVSTHIRENIETEEIRDCLERFGITHVIIPETCFPPIFKIADFIRHEGCKVIAIPNIEIVRMSEIANHEVFDEIWTNNYFTLKHLMPYRHILRTRYIGYPLRAQCETNDYPPNHAFVFCCIGGMNAFSRKQIHKVLEAFSLLHDVANVHLILTNQGDRSDSIHPPECVTYHNKPLSHKDIVQIYKQSHIVIQVSKHEGLGLGFYEALEMRRPVLTLEVPLYREIIQDAGWYIPAETIKNQENKQAVVESYDFYPEDLAHCMATIVKETTLHKWTLLQTKINQRLDDLQYTAFYKRMCKTI